MPDKKPPRKGNHARAPLKKKSESRDSRKEAPAKPKKGSRIPRKPQSKKATQKSSSGHMDEKELEARFGHFSQEVESLGRKADEKGCSLDSWYRSAFGPAGPLISSLAGILFLAVMLWLLGLANTILASTFVFRLGLFLHNYLSLFFVLMLFFSYSSYISKTRRAAYLPFSPFVTALGVTAAFWVAARVLDIANLSLGISLITSATALFQANLPGVFSFLVFLSYLVFMLRILTGRLPVTTEVCMPGRKSENTVPSRAGPRRLYRSGRDKLLGGVCGGIGEYLDVDPVLIRLLWVIGTLAWGAGILAYIIAWIIIPRNPRHKWDD